MQAVQRENKCLFEQMSLQKNLTLEICKSTNKNKNYNQPTEKKQRKRKQAKKQRKRKWSKGKQEH